MISCNCSHGFLERAVALLFKTPAIATHFGDLCHIAFCKEAILVQQTTKAPENIRNPEIIHDQS